MLIVRRLEFDDLLMTMAREAGAEVAEGADITRVSEHAAGVRLEARDGRVFEAPIVVAADGVYSTVAQAPRLQSRLAARPRRDRHDGRDAGGAPPRRR